MFYLHLFPALIAATLAASAQCSVPDVPGYHAVQNLGTKAIIAPRDCNNIDTYMGNRLFTNTTFDILLCSVACDAQTAFNLRHGNPRLCNFWNTYSLDRNGNSLGQYCSFYTEAWANTYATNVGQWRGNDFCTVSNSYSAYNLTSPGFPICPTHIAYLNQEGGHFCTSYNSYVAPHTLLSVVSTVPLTSTIVTTTEAQITVTVTTTVSAVLPTSLKKRDGTSVEEIAIETYMVIYPEKNTADTSATVTIHLTNNGLAKRTAVPTPSSILDWQATRIASACSQVATGTVTDYTTSTFTTYVATETAIHTTNVVTTTTVTVTKPIIQLSSPTAIAGSISGVPELIDDQYYSLVLPFPIGAFGAYSDHITISANGVIALTMGDQPYASWWNEIGFPTNYLPDVSIVGLWDDLVIYPNTQQGIYFQIDGTVVGSRNVTFEFYTSQRLERPTDLYHWTATFFENQPGVVLFRYLEISQLYFNGHPRLGSTTVVGAQRWSTSKSLTFSYRQPLLHAGLFVKLDTIAETISSGEFDLTY